MFVRRIVKYLANGYEHYLISKTKSKIPFAVFNQEEKEGESQARRQL